jgi:hypothetical protein
MLVNTRDKRKAWLCNVASVSNGMLIKKQWSSLWQTQVLSKVKVFFGG